MMCCVVLGCVLVAPVVAELPFLRDDDWLGYFAVHEAQRYDFLLRRDGEITVVPMQRDKDPVAIANRIRVDYGIEELLPGGRTVLKQIRERSLVSEQSETDDIRRLVIRGEATGDSKFELVVEQSRDVMALGGRVIDPGGLTDHPLRFTIRVTIPNVYRRVMIDDKDDQREFDKRTRRDYLELARVDGSRLKLTADDAGDLDAGMLTGSGVEEIEMRLSYYEGRRFYFVASRASGMAVSGGRDPAPWYEGMTLHWFADASKDPEARARLRMWVK